MTIATASRILCLFKMFISSVTEPTGLPPLIIRDNSTLADALNVLKSLYVAGFPANTTVATDNYKTVEGFNPIGLV